MANGDVYDSTWVVASDKRRDLAIIRIKAASLTVIPLGESNDVEVGQTVYSIGNQKDFKTLLQKGLVSAFREANGSRLVQVSVSLNPGNSGCPILDEKGQAVAVAVGGVQGAESLGFAIPINYLKGYLDSKEEPAFSIFAESRKQTSVPPSRPIETIAQARR